MLLLSGVLSSWASVVTVPFYCVMRHSSLTAETAASSVYYTATCRQIPARAHDIAVTSDVTEALLSMLLCII